MEAHDKITRVPGCNQICVFVDSYYVRRFNAAIKGPSRAEVNEAGVIWVYLLRPCVARIELVIWDWLNVPTRVECRKKAIDYIRIGCPLDQVCVRHCFAEANRNVRSLLDVRMKHHFIFIRVVQRLNVASILRFKKRCHFWFLLRLLLKLLLLLIR